MLVSSNLLPRSGSRLELTANLIKGPARARSRTPMPPGKLDQIGSFPDGIGGVHHVSVCVRNVISDTQVYLFCARCGNCVLEQGEPRGGGGWLPTGG